MPNSYVALGESQAVSGKGKLALIVPALLTGFAFALWVGGAGQQQVYQEPITAAAMPLKVPRVANQPQLRGMATPAWRVSPPMDVLRAAPQFRNIRAYGEKYDELSPTGKEIIDKLKTLTILEASDLVSAIEEEFGVDASMPAGGAMMMAPMPGMAAGGGAAPAAEEKTTFDVVLEAVDDSKRVAALKVVRGLTGLGLKETKDFMASLPKAVKEGAKKEECEEILKELQGAGATAKIV